MRTRVFALAVPAVLLVSSLPGQAASTLPAAPRSPALFNVGAAVRGIDPPVPVYAGGYGSYAGATAIRKTYAPLEVRAFYVSNGRSAVEIAVVDSQAEFAAVQQGPWGLSDVRADAARQIAVQHLGPALPASAMIVQSTHSHSAPTAEGIWGPVPDRYLKLLHDQTVAALVAAAQAARPAHLQVGSVTSRDIDDVSIADDTLAGWYIDGQISALRATDPVTGATIATYVTVPAHPVTINGQARKVLGPDYFGPLRDDLQRELGGTVVAGPATLGRQEPPVQTTDYRQLAFYARVLSNLVTQALSTAHPVTDPTLASSETMLEVPATNAAILGLVYAWALPEPQRTQAAKTATLYPADRSLAPPYVVGNTVGTPLTALRIGRTLLLSMPGEPYPEVVQAVKDAVGGTDMVIALSKAQDDLGYFMPAWAYSVSAAEGTDHPIFSVAPQMGDQVAQAQTTQAGAVGFPIDPVAVSVPGQRDYLQVVKPGLQALSVSAGDAGPDGRYHPELEAVYNTSVYAGSRNVGGVRWDFGDGNHATTGYLLTAKGPQGRSFVDHGFAPGTHHVTVTATDANGDVATWTTTVLAHPALHAAVGRTPLAGGLVRLTAHASGGDGHLLAATWTVGSATHRGLSTVVTQAQARTAHVVVVDGTGTVARR
jgi:hypothetical protein